MKRLIYTFALLLISISTFAGAGLWHSNISLTINGTKNTYYITQNSDFSQEKKIESSYTLSESDKSITINSLRIDVWKDGSGNICGGQYTISVGSIKQTINPSWKSNSGNNQVWEYSETKKLDLSSLDPGKYTLSISGYATGNSSGNSGCNNKFNDKTLSCEIIIPEPPKPNNPEITYFTASPSEIDLEQSVTFSVEVENADKNDVVFKNGDETISNPWTPTEGGVYNITANLDGATSKSVNVTVYAATVYFDNTISGWTNVYAYCWNEGGSSNSAWPGVLLNKPAEGNYTYKTTETYEKIIFNAGNNQPQTADLLFENGKTYSMPKPITDPLVAGTANLCGSNWSDTDENNVMVDGGDSKVFSKTYSNLPAGDYEFKVVHKGEWYGFEKLDTENSTKGAEDKGGNIAFQLIDQRDVTISYNIETKKIIITATGIDNFGYTFFIVGDTIYFSSDKNASRYAAYLYGPNDKNTWVNVNQKYKNIYSFEVPNGEWNGLVFCSMKNNTTNDWNYKDAQTVDLRYEGKNWYFWDKDNENCYWRNFENLIFADQKLYFKPDSIWEADSARFAAYFWDIVGENKWANCKYNDEEHVFEVVAPTVGEGDEQVVWTNIKFMAMNPAFDDNAWNKDDETDKNGKQIVGSIEY